MMKSIWPISMLVPFLWVQQSAFSQPAATAPQAFETKTLLWQVSGKGLEKPSWFLGTMHMLCKEDAQLTGATLKVLEAIDAVYLEVDMDNMMEMLGALKAMQMRGDTTLQDLLSAEDFARVKAAFEGKMPLPFAVLQKMKPLMLSSLFSEQILPCKTGAGTEALLMEEAKKRNLAIEGLETAAYQAGLFDSIPYHVQAAGLIQSMNDSGNSKILMEAMIQAFREQDLEKLYTLTLSEEGGVAGYLDLLLFNRNRNWVKKFPAIASGGSYLFAVGAGHLPGNAGVLQLLQAAGYTVTPVENPL